jgi:hypothetical protein
MDLTDVYRIFHYATAQYIFFSPAHGILSNIDHTLGYKSSLNKYKKIEIVICTLYDNATTEEIAENTQMTGRLNNTLFHGIEEKKGRNQNIPGI